MTTVDRDRIAAAFEDELARAPLPSGFRDDMLREAGRRRHAGTSDGHPKALALVAAVLAIAIVATLVVIAKSPRTTLIRPSTGIAAGALAFRAIGMFGDSGWALAAGAKVPGVPGILVTGDGARTWLDVTPALSKAESIAAYHPIDANRAWLVTSSAIDGAVRVWTTADRGGTWSVAAAPSIKFVSPPLLFTDGSHGWLAGPGEPTSEFQQQPISIAGTSDGGRTWQQLSVTGFPPDASTPRAPALNCGKQGMSFLDANTGWLTGGCLAGITFEVTADGGRTWHTQALASPDGRPFTSDCDAGPCSLSAPRFVTAGFAYMVLDDFDNAADSHRSTLYVTVDGGHTWSRRPLPGGDARVTMLDASAGYAALGQPAIQSAWLYRTQDGGQTWQPVAANVDLTAALLDCTSATTCWALSPLYNQPDDTTRLFRTSDGGVTWTALSGNQPSPSPTSSAKGLFGRSWKLGTVASVAAGGDAVYALFVPPGTQGAVEGASNTMLARIDRSTGKVTTAGPFPGAITMAVAGPSVWLGHSPEGSAPNPDSTNLIQLDQATLKVQRRIQLPSDTHVPVAALAGSGGLLFMGYGSTLYQLDPTAGQALRSASLAGPASSISLDPSATRLYVGSDGCGAGVVTEWDTSTLRRIASSATGGGCLGGPTVSASKDGVWVSYATGNLGLFEHRRSADLAVVPSAGVLHSNAIRVEAAGNRVWALDAGQGRLACLNPGTGAELAGWDIADGTAIGGDAKGIFIGRTDGLYELVIDPRCG